MTGPASPYRLAPPRALAPAPRPPGRLLTWWRDVVGAAVTLWGAPHATRAHREAWARETYGPAFVGWVRRYGDLGPWGWPKPPALGPTTQRQEVSGGSVGIQAGGDVTIGLTRAPPRVATGEVGEPAGLGAPGGDWRVAALGMWLRDEARANARKGGPL